MLRPPYVRQPKTLFRRRLASQPHRRLRPMTGPSISRATVPPSPCGRVFNRLRANLAGCPDPGGAAWQFIGSSHACAEDGRVVCLEAMVARDPRRA